MGDVELGDAATLKMREKAVQMKFQIEYTKYSDREDALKENMEKTYSLIFQTYCTTQMQTRIEQQSNFVAEVRDKPIKLSETIQILMHNQVRGRYP